MNLQQTIHGTFSAHAAQSPDRIALEYGATALTYGALEARANRVAAFLLQRGIRRGDRVGLYANRSLEAMAALLGILKAGAAYVPFDPSYPAKLLRFMFEDCTPGLMLVQASLRDPEDTPFWSGDCHELETAEAAQPAVAFPETGPEDLAYVMYTSGSTGRPKGVLIPHRGVVRLVIDNPFADMDAGQVHLQLAPLAFDASTFEIWGALLNGAKLAVLDVPRPSLDDIAAAIARHGVTTLWLTAGLFHLMVDHRLQGLAPLRQLIAGGDVLSPSHVAKAQAGLPRCQLINGYGPTENTTFSCCYRIPPGVGPGPIPIGKPIARSSAHIVDDSGRLVSDGRDGELYVGGEGLALGYLNRPELTAERFVANPFDPENGARLYRTGDRVRQRMDGNIEFLGRLDRQVKINGKRVELDEIESCLRRCPTLEDAAVIASPGHTVERKVHAYVTFGTGSPATVADVREFLRQEAPDYMMPASFTVMESLPLSPNGKVDRARLPPPQLPGDAPPATATAAASANDTTAMLQRIWRDVLGTAAVSVDDNFFDLGGTSLQLVQVHATIVAAMHSDLTLVELFQYPRISALAARIAMAQGSEKPSVPAMPGSAGGSLDAGERARRQQAALARARAGARRSSP